MKSTWVAVWLGGVMVGCAALQGALEKGSADVVADVQEVGVADPHVRKLAVFVLERARTPQPGTRYAEVTPTVSRDMDFPAIAHEFGCTTTLGTACLAGFLQLPLHGDDTSGLLAQRRACIQALLKDEKFRSEVETLLSGVRAQEMEVGVLLSDFFKGSMCPELANLELLKRSNSPLEPFTRWVSTSLPGRAIVHVACIGGAVCYAGFTAWLGGAVYPLISSGWSAYSSELPALALGGAMTGIYSYAAVKDFRLAAEKRDKLHALHELVCTAMRLEELCEQHDLVTQFSLKALKDQKALEVLNGLRHSRYRPRKARLFAVPAVHAFLFKLYDEEQELAHLFSVLGELDVYYTCAQKLMHTAAQPGTPFCFAERVQSTRPVITMRSLWNLLVPKPVLNDIDESACIILTGPNAGGKTTAIRAILQNILFAQTLGIAAASVCRITPYAVIGSYLNISDDLHHGFSLFASEVRRAQEIAQRIQALCEDEKFFFALDELFTGTAAEDGEACAYEFLQHIMKTEQIQFVYATHFKRLTQLAAQTGRCVNYRVGAPTKDSAGVLHYPFTLELGINQVNVARDMARYANLF